MYTEVTRIRKPDPHVHEGDPNPVHTEVAKMAVFGSDICADLSGSWLEPSSAARESTSNTSLPNTYVSSISQELIGRSYYLFARLAV